MNFEVIAASGDDRSNVVAENGSIRKDDLEDTTPDSPATHADEEEHRTREDEDVPLLLLTKSQQRYAWFMSDVLLYICILNLANEFVRNIYIARFSNSLGVAVVLKLVLGAIQAIEHHIKHLMCDVWNRKFVGAVCMWLVVFSSKFLILWIDDVIFRSQVDLGYFWEILILSLVLVLSSILSRWIFAQLGRLDRRRDNNALTPENGATTREQSNAEG